MTISSANAVFLLSVPPIFTSPQTIQQWGSDDFLDTDPLESAEVQMGIDGHQTGGFVFVSVRQMLTLMADSISIPLFDTWYASQLQVRDLYYATATPTLPSIATKYAMVNGILHTYPPISLVKRRLEVRRFGISWESVTPSPIIGVA
jgi:hypothetical protein